MNNLSQFKLLYPFTIEGLRQRNRNEGVIRVKDKVLITNQASSYKIEYPSGELTISGIISVPFNNSLHPVIILNHGYVPPNRYKSGEKTAKISEYLAANGYLTISPDFRGWGNSDRGNNFFRAGLVLDVLNLIDILPSLPSADHNRIGIWGHSMGAGTALKSIAVDSRIKACILYAPMSLKDVEIFSRWGNFDIEMEIQTDTILDIYKKSLGDLDFLSLTSPDQYIKDVTAPVQIHTGIEDKVALSEWANEIFNRFKSFDKNIEIYKYYDQGHYFQEGALKTMFDRCKMFFDNYL